MPLLEVTSYLSIFSKSQVSGKFFLVGISRAAGGPAPALALGMDEDASDEGCASDEACASDEGASDEKAENEGSANEDSANEAPSDEAASEYII